MVKRAAKRATIVPPPSRETRRGRSSSANGRVRGREFADGRFPPDRYMLVEARLLPAVKGCRSLASWIVGHRKADPPKPYAAMAHELMNLTGLHVTNETVRKWTQHLINHPAAQKSYLDHAA